MKQPSPTRRKTPDAATADDADPAAAELDLGPLPDLIGYALRRSQVAVFADFIATLSELELRPAQFSVLLLVERNPGRKQSDFAGALGIQRPNFVAMMDELDRRGLTRRITSQTDRRSYALELTRKGEAVLDRAMALVADHEARMLKGLDDAEARQLFKLLHRMHQSLEP